MMQSHYHETCDLTTPSSISALFMDASSTRLMRQSVCIWSTQSETPFDGKAYHCWSGNIAANSICRIPRYIKIVDEQNATDLDGYINVQRRKASPNFVLSVFQLRCSDARQYHDVYEGFFNRFWSRGVYGVGRAAHGGGDSDDEIFLVPLQLDGRIRDSLRVFTYNDDIGPEDSAMFLFVRRRVAMEPQASLQTSGDGSWMAFNPWWWPLQPVQGDGLDGGTRATADPEKDFQDYIAFRSNEPLYAPPKEFDTSLFVPTG